MVEKDVETGQPSATYSYGIPVEALCQLNDDKDLSALRQAGDSAGLAKVLLSDLDNGLHAEGDAPGSVAHSRKSFGANVWPSPPAKSLWSLIVKNGKDPILIMLAIAGVVATVLGGALKTQREENGWIEGIAIWIAIAAVLTVGAGNDYSKEKQFRKLNAAKDVFDVTVIRDGTEVMIPTTELVVGDIVVLDTGNKVAGDGVLTLSHGLTLDEASLTGESEMMKKNEEKDPWLRCGTQVTEGSGRMLVLAVGIKSEWGRTMALVGGSTGGRTPLQEKLAWLAKNIAIIGSTMALALFIGLMIRWMVINKGFPGSKFSGTEEENGPVQFFLFCVTLLVVAIPEGLPLAVTIALAYSVRQMMRDNNFVRVMEACETMGGINAICSDKTGTLTENRMTVVEGWFAGVVHNTAPHISDLPKELAQELQRNIALNSKAFIINSGDDQDLCAESRAVTALERHGGDPTIMQLIRRFFRRTGRKLFPRKKKPAPAKGDLNTKSNRPRVEYVGNRTECALLALMSDWGGSFRKLRQDFKDDLPCVWGFSSERKMSSVLLHLGEGNYRLYNKGAAEWVLKQCVAWQDTQPSQAGIQEIPMDDQRCQELLDLVESMASRGLRCICLAYRDLKFKPSEVEGDALANPPEGQLVLQCIVGIKDPVRPEVPGAVADCQAAGIFVRMVTGDNVHTARFIAKECGILREGGLVLEGPAFRALTDEERLEVAPRLQVLARSSPEDKYVLVKALRSLRQVVAVTGDGTNDAPALKESDVGLAMGIAGTEVAKEAADIVILDDNFSSIVKAVVWGRTVFSNIRKFLQFQLTVNLSALTVCFIYPLITDREPLNIIQLLWVNLVMNTMAALALATELPNPKILKHKPYGRSENLITSIMWRYMIVNAVYQIVWMFIILFVWPQMAVTGRYAQQNKCQIYVRECPGVAARPAVDLPIDTCGLVYAGTRIDPLNTGSCDARKSSFDLYAVCSAVDPTAPRTNSCPEAASAKLLHKALNTRYVHVHEDEVHRTLSVLFNAFIFMQIFNEVCSRRIDDEYDITGGLFTNPVFVGVLLVTVTCQAIIINFLTSIFKINALDWREWLYTIAIGAGTVPLSYLNRWVYRTFYKPRVMQKRYKKAEVAAIKEQQVLERWSKWSSAAPGIPEAAIDVELAVESMPPVAEHQVLEVSLASTSAPVGSTRVEAGRTRVGGRSGPPPAPSSLARDSGRSNGPLAPSMLARSSGRDLNSPLGRDSAKYHNASAPGIGTGLRKD